MARRAKPIAVTACQPGAIEPMQIYGPFRLTTTQATGGAAAAKSNPSSQPSRIANAGKPQNVDQLDLSSAATSANRLDGNNAIAGGGEIRVDRVADIRRQIADGNYDTPEKLDAALDRFLDELA